MARLTSRGTVSGWVGRLENATALDRVAMPLKSVVAKLIAPLPIADVLHGVPLGHPLHPLLAQGALGCFVSATIVDRLPGPRISSRVLIGAGLACAGPAVASGYADWSKGHEQVLRVGLVHSWANAAASGLYLASLLSRGDRGRRLSLAGFAVAGVGGLLGGHMSYRQASGANHTEAAPHLVAPGWHDLCALDDVPGEGSAIRRVLDTTGPVTLLLARSQGEIRVLADRCSHLAGPLSQGEIADGCVTCPWHRSTFDLSDGSVVHGPATSPQPSFATRVENGRLLVMLPGAG